MIFMHGVNFAPFRCDENGNHYYKGEIEDYDWYEDEFIITQVYIYWDIGYNRWILYDSDFWSFGYCNEINIADCNGKWTFRYEDKSLWYSYNNVNTYGSEGAGVDVCTEWDGECGGDGCSFILGMQCWDCLTILNTPNNLRISS